MSAIAQIDVLGIGTTITLSGINGERITATGVAAGGSTPPATSRTPWLITAFFIDPQNSTGLASDANTGLTALTPILTTAEFNRRIFSHDVQVASTITYLSDDTALALVDLSTISVSTGQLNFQGTPQTVHTGGTLATVTNINAAANQDALTGASDLVGAGAFDPFVWNQLASGTATTPVYIVDTVSSVFAWIANANGNGSTASLAKPLNSTSTAGANLTAGHAYAIRRGSVLAVQFGVPAGDGLVTFQDFALSSSHFGINGAQYTRCSFNSLLNMGCGLTNCFIGAGALETIAVGAITVSGGVWVATTNDSWASPTTWEGDVYVTGVAWIWGSNAYADVFLTPGFGAGVQVHHMSTTSGAVAISDSQVIAFATAGFGSALLWGKNNAGFGLGFYPGGVLTVGSGASVIPTITGALGDISFLHPASAGLVTFARGWNEAAGTPSGAATASWANFANAAVFNFSLHDFGTNAAIIGV